MFCNCSLSLKAPIAIFLNLNFWLFCFELLYLTSEYLNFNYTISAYLTPDFLTSDHLVSAYLTFRYLISAYLTFTYLNLDLFLISSYFTFDYLIMAYLTTDYLLILKQFTQPVTCNQLIRARRFWYIAVRDSYNILASSMSRWQCGAPWPSPFDPKLDLGCHLTTAHSWCRG